MLDEQDYSDREFVAFVECFNSESWYMGLRAELFPELDTDHPAHVAALNYALENYLGYSDPGYISEEHVAESWHAVGVEF